MTHSASSDERFRPTRADCRQRNPQRTTRVVTGSSIGWRDCREGVCSTGDKISHRRSWRATEPASTGSSLARSRTTIARSDLLNAIRFAHKTGRTDRARRSPLAGPARLQVFRKLPKCVPLVTGVAHRRYYARDASRNVTPGVADHDWFSPGAVLSPSLSLAAPVRRSAAPPRSAGCRHCRSAPVQCRAMTHANPHVSASRLPPPCHLCVLYGVFIRYR